MLLKEEPVIKSESDHNFVTVPHLIHTMNGLAHDNSIADEQEDCTELNFVNFCDSAVLKSELKIEKAMKEKNRDPKRSSAKNKNSNVSRMVSQRKELCKFKRSPKPKLMVARRSHLQTN